MTTTDMHGKIVLVTGGTGGIGQHTAIGLASRGAHIVVTGRDEARGQAGVAAIKQASGSAHVDLLLADLSRQADIRQLADTFGATYDRLDVLINNVGLLEAKRRLTTDGVEAHLAVNVLAPFLLTHELLDLLRASAPARVINVTGGIPGRIDLNNLQAEASFQGLQTYSHAKSIMMAMSYEFAQRLQGTGVTLNVAYPGAAATAMTQAMTPATVPLVMRLIWPLFRVVMNNAKPERAARSSIYLASSADVVGVNGVNFGTNSKPTKWPEDVRNASKRQRLWQISEQLTGMATPAADTTHPHGVEALAG